MKKDKKIKTPNQFECTGCGDIRTILPKFHKSIDRSTWLCKKCRKDIVKHRKILVKKIDNTLKKYFSKGGIHDALEKYLVVENLIKDHLGKELKNNLKNKVAISKGVVRDGNGEVSGDCDLIIFEKKKRKYEKFGEIVSVERECVKAIISINRYLRNFKKKNQIKALETQKKFCGNDGEGVFVVGCNGQKETKEMIAKKIKDKMIQDNIFLLKEENDFDKLVEELKAIVH